MVQLLVHNSDLRAILLVKYLSYPIPRPEFTQGSRMGFLAR